jgi:single-stranded DNA-specific DHH superfamily exonuclease
LIGYTSRLNDNNTDIVYEFSSVIYQNTTKKKRIGIVSKGLPEPNGTIISVLAANPKISGEFYAVNNRGIFCSIDSGISWEMLDEYDGIQWSNEYLSQHPKALAVRDGS